ncbi:MAG: hypothetical protein JO053_11990 [Acidobacteria bacterium]|nr:hypothetical protein [Acidobacteriota bacterium]
MKQFFIISLAICACTCASLAQAKVNITDIQKQIAASPAKRNITATFDPKSNRSTVATTHFILGRQDVMQQSTGDTNSFSGSLPSWDVMVRTAFETDTLAQTVGDFAWAFNVYNPRFSPETDLVIKADDQTLTYHPAKTGRSTVSNMDVQGTAQLDKTQDMIQNNTGNIRDAAKPIYMIFVISREDMIKISKAAKVKISLSKQYDINEPKDLKGSIDTMLAVTEIH